MVGHKGPCPLTAPCLSVLWLSVGLRGVVDVPPAAWVAMPDLDRTALPSGGDLACRIGGLRKEGRQSYVLALLQCVLRSILPSARGQEGIDALNNAMKDTDAALKPGCRAGWGRRGGLKRIPRRHTLQEWKTTTTIATGQATVKPDTPSCFPDCALGLGCTSAGACPASRTSLDTSDALSNATNDTNAVLRPGCRAGWGRRGGLKRIPRRHTLQEWETTTTIATGQATDKSSRGPVCAVVAACCYMR
jgi:hypothetical protein